MWQGCWVNINFIYHILETQVLALDRYKYLVGFLDEHKIKLSYFAEFRIILNI